VHVDLAIPNFGIQEAREFTQEEQDVFPGCPELKEGWLTVGDRPGLGIDVDEKLAAKFPIKDDPPFDLKWGQLRRRDGSITAMDSEGTHLRAWNLVGVFPVRWKGPDFSVDATDVLEEAARGTLAISSLAEESRPPAATGGDQH
jgi:hypothetical protein